MMRIIGFWEGWGVYLLLPLLAGLVALDIALRYLFNVPLQWGSDVKELLLLAVVTIGLPGTSLSDQHIRVALIDGWLSPNGRRIWATARHLLTGIVALLIAYAVGDLAWDMFRFGDRAEMINIPFWPIAACVAVSAGLSALAEFGRAVSSVRSTA